MALGVDIIDGKLLFYHIVSEGDVDKKNSTIFYNNRKFYECSNDPFPAYFGSPDLNLPPINVDGRPRSHKRAHYAQDMLPYTIYVASENSVGTFTTPSDSPLLLIMPSDYPNLPHAMNKDEPYRERVKIIYCSRKNDEKICYERRGSIAPRTLIKTRNFITVMGFTILIQRQLLASWNINIVWNKDSVCCCVCLSSTLYFTC